MVDIVNVFLNTPVGTDNLYVIDVIYFVIIIIATFILAAFISKKIKKGLSGWMPVNDREMTSKIVYFSIVAIGILVALPHLHVELSGLLIAGGFLSIIIGLAGQTVIANFFSGLILFFDQAHDGQDLDGRIPDNRRIILRDPLNGIGTDDIPSDGPQTSNDQVDASRERKEQRD